MKTSTYNGSIFKRLFKMMFVTTSAIVFIGYIIFVNWYTTNAEETNLSLSRIVSKTLSQDLAKLILLDDVSTAADITSKLKAYKNIRNLVVFNKKGDPIYQYSKNDKSFSVGKLPKNLNTKITKCNMKIYEKAMYSNKELGIIQIDIKYESLLEIFKDDFLVMLLLYLFAMLLSYGLAYFYANYFTKPILKLVYFLEHIDITTMPSKRVHTTEDNEFGKLYEEINIMLSNIESSFEAQKIAAVAFEAQSGMAITDENKNILQTNSALSKILGYSSSEIIGKNTSIFEFKIYGDEYYRYATNILQEKNIWNAEYYVKDSHGKNIVVSLSVQSVFNDNHTVKYYIYSFVDITLRKEMEKKLKYLQQYDPLTGLANKNMFLDVLQNRLDGDDKKRWHILFFIDIKDFKNINNLYGHDIGDWVLKEFAQRLKEEFKDSDFISKIGIDEFILSFRNIGNVKERAFMEAEKISAKLKTIASYPFKISHTTVDIILRIGINIYNQEIKKATIILKRADNALQVAKKQDREIAFFNREAEVKELKYLSTYKDLIVAIKEKQFELYYQLQYKSDKSIYGAEALIRWNHPTKGVVPPFEFIQIAEDKDLIIDIGDWVLQEGCRQLKEWEKDEKTKNWVLAINASAKQFNTDDFVSKVLEATKKYKINPNRLKVELTESLLIDDYENIIQKMIKLRESGIKISIDDFGTGYSSLQYLRNFPTDQIKIDQAFIFNMTRSKEDAAIIQVILKLGDALGFEVIAEGVETKEHYELLESMGCKYYQGYYFAKPKKLADIIIS